MMKSLFNLVNRLRPKSPLRAVRVSDEDVSLFEDDRQYARFAWGDVQKIAVFKRDLGICDDIRLAFCVDGGWFEVSEDFVGWSDLSAAIGFHFPASPPDWYKTVMLPPFETCYRILHERTSS